MNPQSSMRAAMILGGLLALPSCRAERSQREAGEPGDAATAPATKAVSGREGCFVLIAVIHSANPRVPGGRVRRLLEKAGIPAYVYGGVGSEIKVRRGDVERAYLLIRNAPELRGEVLLLDDYCDRMRPEVREGFRKSLKRMGKAVYWDPNQDETVHKPE